MRKRMSFRRASAVLFAAATALVAALGSLVAGAAVPHAIFRVSAVQESDLQARDTVG